MDHFVHHPQAGSSGVWESSGMLESGERVVGVDDSRDGDDGSSDSSDSDEIWESVQASVRSRGRREERDGTWRMDMV